MQMKFLTFWQSHHQDGVQANDHILFGAQKLPTGSMQKEFRIAFLVLCTTNRPKTCQISLSVKQQQASMVWPGSFKG